MNSFAEFLVPQFNPRTLDELTPEPDEVTSLVYLEDSIAKELNSIRDYNKNKRPLGQPAAPEDAPSEPEDPAAAAAAAGPPTSEDEPSSAGDFEESADEIDEVAADDVDVDMAGDM